MSLPGKGLGRALLVAAAVLALDQLTKIVVRAEIEPGEQIGLPLGVELVRVSNDGIAFGLLGDAGVAVVIVAAAAFVLLLAYFFTVVDRPGLWLPLGLLAGGALGNLLDRLTRGAVTDFIDPPNWPAFNVADIAITLGVVALLLLFVHDPTEEPAEERGEARDPAR